MALRSPPDQVVLEKWERDASRQVTTKRDIVVRTWYRPPIEILGYGSYGIVFSAFDKRNGDRVAVKFIIGTRSHVDRRQQALGTAGLRDDLQDRQATLARRTDGDLSGALGGSAHTSMHGAGQGAPDRSQRPAGGQVATSAEDQASAVLDPARQGRTPLPRCG